MSALPSPLLSQPLLIFIINYQTQWWAAVRCTLSPVPDLFDVDVTAATIRIVDFSTTTMMSHSSKSPFFLPFFLLSSNSGHFLILIDSETTPASNQIPMHQLNQPTETNQRLHLWSSCQPFKSRPPIQLDMVLKTWFMYPVNYLTNKKRKRAR